MSFRAGKWLIVAFVVGVLLMLWASGGLSDASARIPRLVLSATLVCLLLQGGREWWAARATPPASGAAIEEGHRRRTVAALAWLALLLSLTFVFGIAPASTLFCLAWFRWHAGERWLPGLISAVGLGLGIWVLFTAILRVDLYPGVLWPAM